MYRRSLWDCCRMTRRRLTSDPRFWLKEKNNNLVVSLPPVLFSKFYLILKYVFHNVVNLNKENISKGNNRRKTLFIPPCILIISWGRFVNSVWVRGLSRRQDTGPCSSYCDMLCFDFHSAIYVVRLCYTSKKCLLFAHSNSPVCLCKTKKKKKNSWKDPFLPIYVYRCIRQESKSFSRLLYSIGIVL